MLVELKASNDDYVEAFAFIGELGQGALAVTAAAPAVDLPPPRLDLPLTVIGAREIDDLAIAPTTIITTRGTPASVEVSALRAQAPVFGASCDWLSSPDGLRFTTGHVGTLSERPRITYLIDGKPGIYRAECVISGPLRKPVTVEIRARSATATTPHTTE